ncbi:MAG: hypothetical protein HRT42_09585 [Campylobacteraceae bacterium]|nr:hypothetical protein [Campylobacteraceae bacterium]
MKTILLIFILIVSIKAEYTFNCKYSARATTLYNYSELGGLEGSHEADPDGTDILASFDIVNDGFLYWDNDSPVCGGSSFSNILYDATCSDTQTCSYEPTEGAGANSIVKNINEMWTNILILVDGYPCMPHPLSSVSVGLYNYETLYDMGVFDFRIDGYYLESTEYVSSSVAAEQRAICEDDETPDPTNPGDSTNYTGQLNQLIDNTSKNKSQDERSQSLSDRLTTFIDNLNPSEDMDADLSGFQRNFEGKLGDAYSTYADVFGFSSYGAAPAVISFDLFNVTYEVFNIEIIEPYINNIRLVFLTFAYLWGFIIVIKTI